MLIHPQDSPQQGRLTLRGRILLWSAVLALSVLSREMYVWHRDAWQTANAAYSKLWNEQREYGVNLFWAAHKIFNQPEANRPNRKELEAILNGRVPFEGLGRCQYPRFKAPACGASRRERSTRSNLIPRAGGWG